jgi:hypothetical protein
VKFPKISLSPSQQVEVKRDLLVLVSAFVATGVLDSAHPTVAGLVAAAVTAVKVAARSIFKHDVLGTK